MFKRHLDECQQRRRDAGIGTPAAKRVRRDAAGTDLGDCSEVGTDFYETLVHLLAVTASAGFKTLVHAIPGASKKQIEQALYRVIDKPTAVARICNAAGGRINRPDEVLQEAASQCVHGTVAILVDRVCSEFEITCVLARLIKQGDREGVLAIVDACESSPEISPVVYKRLVEASLGKATKRDAINIINDLAPRCDGQALRRVLLHCASRNYDIKGFEAVWEHADLCAHDLADDVEPGAARDFLHDVIHKGDGCRGVCPASQPDNGACVTEAPHWRPHTSDLSALSV
ncbi:hypothetical protein pqer_cds_1020 [Pandoravirus quercus]|uniref:Uncharacterized protein n=1 Tax=Pandoravirus quercus TaxID=2107709 RepID=A0A2U7UAL9_9VIRU|nr:hypothetical protein pqer_cds_1020 [Pandoravirus quercus]AVK75442.1 hypothetical protein pqer_cds_1020 [Pandoravirus quercus]